MAPLSTFCIILIVIFLIVVFFIVTQVLYVFWFRRRFRRQSSPAGHPELPGDPFSVPSKELLYFFCWKRQSGRIEPHADPAVRPGGLPSDEIDDVDILKWQDLYGPSRVLFTIKEEETEETETRTADKPSLSSSETKSVSLGECFSVADDEPPPELTPAVGVDEATPFSTPCASPLYFTPSPSPTREAANRTNSQENGEIGNLVLTITGAERGCSESEVSSGSNFSFVSIEVQSE